MGLIGEVVRARGAPNFKLNADGIGALSTKGVH